MPYTTYKDQISSQDAIHFGVPQGSIISPALFNAYIRDIPDPPANIHIISYADDITIFSSGTNIPQITEQLNIYLTTLSQFLKDRQLIISPQKSSVTLFTPDNAQLNYHPQVTINGNLLPLEKTPKILGVTFDPKLTFGIHTTNTTTKIHKRNDVLKALSGTSEIISHPFHPRQCPTQLPPSSHHQWQSTPS